MMTKVIPNTLRLSVPARQRGLPRTVVKQAYLAAATPGVVSITRILARSGFRPIETGPFDVRIILTEEPRDGFTADMVNVENGTAGTPVKGLTYKGASARNTISRKETVGPDATAVTIPAYTVPAQLSELTAEMLDYHIPGTTDATPLKANADKRG